MTERSELYEVLALLEKSSISKEKEEKFVKKTEQPMIIDHNDDEDNHNNAYNDNDQSNHYSKNDNSHRNNSNDALKPPRLSSMPAPVIAHKSSYLPIESNDSSVDAIDGEEQEQEKELSLPSDKAVRHLGPKG